MATHSLKLLLLRLGLTVSCTLEFSLGCATRRAPVIPATRSPDATHPPTQLVAPERGVGVSQTNDAHVESTSVVPTVAVTAQATPDAAVESLPIVADTWIPLRPGVRFREQHCGVKVPTPLGEHPLVFKQVRVDHGSDFSIRMLPNPSATAPGVECSRGYSGSSPADFLTTLKQHGPDAVAAINGSLFFRAPVDLPLAWWPEGLAWSPSPVPSITPSDSPLRFNECRNDRSSLVVLDEDGLHEVKVVLEPCPAGTALVPSVREQRRQWCGDPADGPAHWGYEHREACARLDAQSVASLPPQARTAILAGATHGSVLLRSPELISRMRNSLVGMTAAFQITGPWPSFNDGTLDSHGRLIGSDAVCTDDMMVDTHNMNLPAIRGIHGAVCHALARTVICGHADGGISLLVTHSASLEDIARAVRPASGCGFDCTVAFNLDGGGSTQMSWWEPTATVPRAWGIPQRAPCGPYRAPANFVVVVHR